MDVKHVWGIIIGLDLLLLLFFPLRVVLLTTVLLWIYLNREFLKIVYATLPRDAGGIFTFIRVELEMKSGRKDVRLVGKVFDGIAKSKPDKVAVVSVETGQTRTFTEVNELANQIGNFFHAQGFEPGDCIALFMPNSIDYIPFWLGLSRIGVITALVNFNQRLSSLAHSIRVAKSKAVICSPDLEQALQDAVGNNNDPEQSTSIDPSVTRYVYGSSSLSNVEIEGQIRNASKQLPAVNIPDAKFNSPLFYIYTSGTTGLPKAAVITHGRFTMMARGVYHGFGMQEGDRIYVTMPLYHSAAGILGAGAMVLSGVSLAIRSKFSASRFWTDCDTHNCTVSQYIGELCRYLLAQPPSPTDQQHRIRMMFGNGLRPQIWETFTHRFNIAQIGEFYGSTEGNTSLLNTDNKVGACGFIPIYTWLRLMYPVCLIRVDEETGEPVRDQKGMCIKCNPGESGMITCTIIKGHPVKDFKGYLSGKDTSKKIVTDVLRRGDQAFASGDILHWDKYGYVYFKDRTGDTFRWKGENVSTMEVEGVIQHVLKMQDATAYGVQVPGADGKAGMAAIVGEPDECLKLLAAELPNQLPPYARPLFLRFLREMDTTGTFKLQKTTLRNEGFDPARVGGDLLFYWDGKEKRFQPLTADTFADIEQGRIRF